MPDTNDMRVCAACGGHAYGHPWSDCPTFVEQTAEEFEIRRTLYVAHAINQAWDSLPASRRINPATGAQWPFLNAASLVIAGTTAMKRFDDVFITTSRFLEPGK